MGQRWNFDSMLLTTREMHMQNLYARVWNKIFALHNVLKSHLSYKLMRRSFAERGDAHTDTKNMWDMYNRFWDKFTEELKLVPSFSLSSLMLAWRTCTFINIQYAVALLTKMGYRLAQESNEYLLWFRTYAGWIKSLLIFFLLGWWLGWTSR